MDVFKSSVTQSLIWIGTYQQPLKLGFAFAATFFFSKAADLRLAVEDKWNYLHALRIMNSDNLAQMHLTADVLKRARTDNNPLACYGLDKEDQDNIL